MNKSERKRMLCVSLAAGAILLCGVLLVLLMRYQVFFAHHAAALTTDVSRTEEWQGGDLVIFENHIGIVSDRRNKNGVPYIIHHNDPWQSAYEQDILEKRTDIVGHYRISE